MRRLRFSTWVLIVIILITFILTTGCTENGFLSGLIPPTQIQIKTYSNYSLSFSYPEGITVVEKGITRYSSPSLNSGAIDLKNSQYTVTIVWAKGQPMSFDELASNAVKKLRDSPGFSDISVGNIETKSHLGHTVQIVPVKYKKSSQQYNSQAVFWYCPQSDRMYIISLDTKNDATYATNTITTYLDSFKCH